MADKDNKPKTAPTPARPTARPATTTAAKQTTPTAKPAPTPAAAKPTTAATTKTATSAARPATTAATRPATTTARPTTSTAARPTTPAAKPAPTPAARSTTTTTTRPATTAATPARPAATSNATPARPATAATAKPTATTAAKPSPAPTATARPVAAARPEPKTAVTKTAPTKTAPPTPAPDEKPTATARPAAKPAATEKSTKAAAITAKTEKPQKQTDEKPAKSKSGGGSSIKAKAAAIVKTRNFKLAAIIAAAVIVVFFVILGIVLGVKGCSNNDPVRGGLTVTSIEGSHKNKTQVGYSAETVGTVERYKPVDGMQAAEFSKGSYPKFGSTLNLTTEQKTELILLNRKLTANGTWVDASKRTTGSYDKMDKDGYLYALDGSKPGNGVPEQLYKHTASVGMYGGNVADNEPAVVKTLTYRPRSYGNYYSVTGLYAPAGEVIKIQLTDADMKATSGLTIHIGQALYNGQANNIWEQRGFNRMPVILNTMNITEQTATYDEQTGLWTGYVGSFLGGPIYVRSESATFSVTISGGVNYAHFILGVTTEEEYAAYSKSSAPYFDLEVWDRGVLHSGPKRQAQKFSYEQLYKAAVLWEKIALVTTSVSNQGIVFLYDPFVAAGAAVAFPGRRSVNCPEGWMSGSLNYSAFVTSGAWGNMHEYHHNFQDYGLGSGADGEVTNNGLNLVSYSLFTKISSARQIGGYGGSGLSGWNQYTSASWALQRVNAGSIGSTNGLAIYATLLHNFGQDAYIKARGASGKNNYLNRWATTTHQDMTYYANMINSYGGGNYSPSQAVQNANYPLFVPVSSVYQTGRTYNYDGEKREITTMQPYVIPYGKSFKVDLNPYTEEGGQYRSGSVVIANGFNYTIKGVKTDGLNGTFVETDEKGVYTFTPNKELRSGKIYVTLGITTSSGASGWNGHALDDVDLILEFQQSHESNKAVLERTTYFYTADTAYTDAREAFEKNYVGFESKSEYDHSNPTQNCNTDIWYCTESTLSRFPNANPELHVVKPNSIDELRGKLYFAEAGTYNIYLRGRKNCALYYSTDGGKTYKLGTFIADDSTSADWRQDVYVKLENIPAESWVYFKEVLINAQISSGMAGFIGLGIGQWTTPMYTAEVKYYAQIDGARKDLTQETTDGVTRYYYSQGGNKVYVENNAVQTETIYKNSSGQVVSAEDAANTDLIAPTSIAYATAYRESYEFNKEFESDYFYVRTYSYDYQDNVCMPKNEVTVTDTNYKPTGWGSGMPITNISDGKTNTYIHTSWGVTVNNPLNLTFDLGGERTINRIKFYCRNNNGQLETPKTFTVEGSLDGETWFDVAAYDDAPRNGNQVTVDFAEATLRYCRIVIRQAHQTNYYIVIGEIEFWHVNEINGGTLYSPDDAIFTYKGDWQIAQANATYGHVFLGKKGSELSFEFDAKTETARVGILSSSKYGQNYEVYIDGKKVDTEKLKDDQGETSLRYITPVLSNGKHKITIRCTGEANIDSFVFF